MAVGELAVHLPGCFPELVEKTSTYEEAVFFG